MTAKVDFFKNIDQLFKQELLHISEPDLVYAAGHPHSPCPSSASFSSSHTQSTELYPVRLQEVNLNKNRICMIGSENFNKGCLVCTYSNNS